MYNISGKVNIILVFSADGTIGAIHIIFPLNLSKCLRRRREKNRITFAYHILVDSVR